MPHTLREISYTLKEISHTHREVSHTLTEIPHTLRKISHTLSEISHTLREISTSTPPCAAPLGFTDFSRPILRWLCGTHPPTVERKRSWAHQIGEPN